MSLQEFELISHALLREKWKHQTHTTFKSNGVSNVVPLGVLIDKKARVDTNSFAAHHPDVEPCPNQWGVEWTNLYKDNMSEKRKK